MAKRRKVHRRGGSYELYKSHQITDWSYDPMDKKCLDKLKLGDVVRVCFLEKNEYHFDKRYVRITRQLSRTHFMGVVSDPYRCNSDCRVCGDPVATSSAIWCCDGDLYNRCDIHVHEECLAQCRECPRCHNDLKKVHFTYHNGSKLVFSKSNIIEIPNWTRNTKRLFDWYGWYNHRRDLLTAYMETEPTRSYK
jgi:hypothetical protein